MSSNFCSGCGDRIVLGEPHDCWVDNKKSTQEDLNPVVIEETVIVNVPVVRDDGLLVPFPPNYIDRFGIVHDGSL